MSEEKVLKAFANRRRLAILKLLKMEKELVVDTIAKKIHLSFKSTSHHLRLLTALDILDRDQRSINVFYRLSKEMPLLARHILNHLDQT
ncbi:MAG: metalloregulator ArsR/SmtB family transcription factor [Candidatus Uhrbacteria bacterium]|nr:metalloregulator ArsR/SmtB family transcription factor [Candidatus Uhrbacteria bacterium]MDP3793901.1 metalloregulator ArsR/SmtB family transcription factor [Candidatus Uhrbacteria bacterium]